MRIMRRGLLLCCVALAGCQRPPAPAAETHLPGQSTVMVRAADGSQLHSLLARPEAAPAQAGALLLHQLGGDRYDWVGPLEALQSRGVWALSLGLRGHTSAAWQTFGAAEWRAAVPDVGAGLQELRRHLPSVPIRLAGASIGSSLALLYAAEHPGEVAGVALLSPGLDYHGLDTAAAMAKLKDLPVFIAASSGDRESAAAAQRLAAIHGGVQPLLVAGDAHGTDMLTPQGEVQRRLVDWLANGD